MTRKSPYRHDVGGHTRSGRPVSPYERGKGAKPRTRSRPRRVVGSTKADTGYSITVGYPTGPGDSFNVEASSFLEAIDQGVKRSSKAPTFIRMRRGK